MINFRDRLPTKPNVKKITKSDGSFETVTIEYADDPTYDGTPINRKSMMAIQGFIGATTTFNSNGDISQNFDNGNRTIVKFLEDGSIEQILIDSEGQSITKKTIFEEDGSIVTEVY